MEIGIETMVPNLVMNMGDVGGSVLAFPSTKSVLYVNTELQFHFTYPRPNWWWRMWQWILLGWKWEKTDGE